MSGGSIMNEKGKKYLELIEDVKNDYKNHPEKHRNNTFQLVWRDDCKEINLYTYWQGFNYANTTPNIRVIVMGQDWGNEEFPSKASKMDQQLANGEIVEQYLDGVDLTQKGYETDVALIRLFESVGYPDIDKKRYPDLFFTNYALGYRSGDASISNGMSGNVMDADSVYAKRLFDILEPEIVLCLGKSTYAAAIKAYGFKVPSKSYNMLIEEMGKTPVVVNTSSGKEVHIYPIAHCGTLGTMNRNRGMV